MATLAMDREPDMGRFMDTYKFDKDMDRRRDKFGGGTSLPLNSDGYEDKQRNLRDERHMDWMQQQEKPRDPVYYRVGTPEEGFIGLGKYEQQRQHHNVVRQKDYNDLLKKQNEKEKEKYETRRQAQGRPAPPQGPQIDYDQSQERARAEERRAYQDYMKAKEERYWAQRGKPVTPPGGLNIGTYDRQVKEQAAQKKKDYKEMLDQQSKQKREHMFMRARQEPEVAILDRSGAGPQYQTKPPSGPGYRPRDERQTPRYWNDGKLSRGPPSQDSEVSRRSNRSRDGFVPLAFRVEEPSGRRPIPERPRHGQPPYAGQMEQEVEKEVKKSVEQAKPHTEPPRSPGKQARYQPRQQSPYKPSFADPNVADNHRPPRSPNKEYNGLQAQKAPRERSPERPPEIADAGNSSRLPYEAKPSFLKPSAYEETMGTPLAFKTTPYRHASPHNPAHNRPSNSEEGHLNFNDLDLHPRSTRRSLDGNRRPDNAQISPRRLMNTQYVDSDDVTLKRKEANVERRKEYNDYISEKNEQRQRQEQSRHTHNNKPAELVKNQYYSSEDYERFQKDLQKQQGEEYRDFLSKKNHETRNRDWNYDKTGVLELRGDEKQQSRQRELRAERQQDYNNFISQQKMGNPGRRNEMLSDPSKGPYNGLFQGLGEHGSNTEALNQERKREYNDKLDQQYAGKERPHGRPNWVKEPLPNTVDRGRSPMRNQSNGPPDQYQQMLDEKRREEASRRRYEDPEYQDRLAQGRGDAAPRYGY